MLNPFTSRINYRCLASLLREGRAGYGGGSPVSSFLVEAAGTTALTSLHPKRWILANPPLKIQLTLFLLNHFAELRNSLHFKLSSQLSQLIFIFSYGFGNSNIKIL